MFNFKLFLCEKHKIICEPMILVTGNLIFSCFDFKYSCNLFPRISSYFEIKKNEPCAFIILNFKFQHFDLINAKCVLNSEIVYFISGGGCSYP